jgi:hypothetical protein
LITASEAMDRREWHLDKSLSVGHILTTIMILGALAVQYAQFSARLAVLESNMGVQGAAVAQILDNQRRVDAKQDQEIADIKREIRDNYGAILKALREGNR